MLRRRLAALPSPAGQRHRSMSMFLWRHVPIYRDNPAGKSNAKGWRLIKRMDKPAMPVRVDGLRPTRGKIDFKHAVIMPEGSVHPWRKGEATSNRPWRKEEVNRRKEVLTFDDFWRNWIEEERRAMDYRRARGIPDRRFCPRCDKEMNWLRRVPVNYRYEEVMTKRQVYHKNPVPLDEELDDDDDADDADGTTAERDGDDDADGNDGERAATTAAAISARTRGGFEDRYCCPNDECGLRECHIEFKHNVARVVVLQGISNGRWERRNLAEKARDNAKLAETPWTDRGVKVSINQLEKLGDASPLRSDVSHEAALKIVEQKARARREKKERPSPMYISGSMNTAKEDSSIVACLLCRGIADSRDGGLQSAFGRRVPQILNWPLEAIAGWYSRQLVAYGTSHLAAHLLRDSLACTLMNRHKLRSRMAVYKQYGTQRLLGFPVPSRERPERFRDERSPMPWPPCDLSSCLQGYVCPWRNGWEATEATEAMQQRKVVRPKWLQAEQRLGQMIDRLEAFGPVRSLDPKWWKSSRGGMRVRSIALRLCQTKKTLR